MNNKQSRSTKSTVKRRASTMLRAESHTLDAHDAPLGYEGQKLFDWAQQNFEAQGVEPLLHELCVLADRLSEIRQALKKGLDGRLVNAEVKVCSQFTKTWKLLGLADPPKARPGGQEGIPRAPRTRSLADRGRHLPGTTRVI
jgi:hypothetical protein